MRVLIGCAAAVPLMLASLGAAPADSLGSLSGHWRCAVAGGRPAERSYFPVTAKLGPRIGRREVFGREDTTEPDGAPSTSFEHIVENASDVAIESVEGHGTGANTTPLRFAGRDYDDKAAMELTYAVSGDTSGEPQSAARQPSTMNRARAKRRGRQSRTARNRTRGRGC